jgi:hypothetical protein
VDWFSQLDVAVVGVSIGDRRAHQAAQDIGSASCASRSGRCWKLPRLRIAPIVAADVGLDHRRCDRPQLDVVAVLPSQHLHG